MRRARVYLPYLFLIPFFFFIFKIYYSRVSDFGCFDDCFNFMGGYFLLKGKILYTTIFYNHQMLMAYISFCIQKFLHPQTLYALIVYHRLFALMFAFLFDIAFVIRFRKVGVWFTVIYELTKYYLFGDRFLAEGFSVYPLVYLMGMIWFSWKNKKLYDIEIILSSVLTWFVLFSREPYIPLALCMYGIVIWQNRKAKSIFISLLVFVSLSIGIVTHIHLKDYYFNVFTVNRETVGSMEIGSNNIWGIGGVKIIGYPLWILISTVWNDFRILLVALDSVFLLSIGISLVKGVQRKEIILILIILSLANIRFVTPGNIFYASFHMLPWYGLFVFLTGSLLLNMHTKIRYILFGIFAILFLYTIFLPSYFIWDTIERQKEFVTNFGEIVSNGNVIKDLATPSNTLFLDGHDDMIYWESNVTSSYRYSWYTSVMPRFTLFTQARSDMFAHTPPDFYYAYCPPNAPHTQQLPISLVSSYQALYFSGKPTCVFVKKSIIATITKDRWQAIKNYGYYLPADTNN